MFSISAVVWLILAVVFVAAELIASAYILPYAIGAGAALVASLFDTPLIAQAVIFVVVVVVASLFFKPDKQQKLPKRAKKYEDLDD